MKNKKAFTIVELLVSMFIAAVLMITLGALSEIGNKSQKKVEKEIGIYSDLSHGFKLFQSKVHLSPTVQIENTITGQWATPQLLLGTSKALGIYAPSGLNKRELVYFSDKNDLSTKETIFSVDGTDMNINYSVGTDLVIINVLGTKDSIPFDFSTSIARRL